MKILILLLVLLLIVGCTAVVEKEITNFEECIAAGNPAMESYPRQCRDPSSDKTFTEIIEEPIVIDKPEKEQIGITELELAKHDTGEDCWIVYENKVYDFTETQMHPNMAKTFYSHCGQIKGFEEAAKDQHSSSSQDRISNFGKYIGGLI